MFIALTGGIGAGKSVVARLLRTMGYAVFDCDIEARMLMDGDDDIKARIGAEIAADAIDDQGAIDRARLSETGIPQRRSTRRCERKTRTLVRAAGQTPRICRDSHIIPKRPQPNGRCRMERRGSRRNTSGARNGPQRYKPQASNGPHRSPALHPCRWRTDAGNAHHRKRRHHTPLTSSAWSAQTSTAIKVNTAPKTDNIHHVSR